MKLKNKSATLAPYYTIYNYLLSQFLRNKFTLEVERDVVIPV